MIFLFFSSSLACLEPELELFEVWEINVRQIIIIAYGINSQTPKLQRALTWALDELERNQKKGKSSSYNFQDDGHISSCPVVHVYLQSNDNQLLGVGARYAFSVEMILFSKLFVFLSMNMSQLLPTKIKRRNFLSPQDQVDRNMSLHKSEISWMN